MMRLGAMVTCTEPVAMLLWLSAASGAQPADRIEPLLGFVGSWDTADTYETTSGSATERGIRRCVRALKGSYVECTTLAPRRDGAEREYRFLMSWDESRSAYTLIQLWSDVSGHSVTTMVPSADARAWDLRNVTPQITSGIERRSWGTIEFEGPDRIVWTGRANRSDERPDVWRQVFREVSTRRVTDP